MNETHALNQVKKYIRKYSKLFGSSYNEMIGIAKMESLGGVTKIDPLTRLHPDGVSFGVMGITPITEKEAKNIMGESLDRTKLEDNIKIACWYWGFRIPQMLNYFGFENTLENRVISYNAGISYVTEKKNLPARTMAYISHMQDQKKNSLLHWFISALVAVKLFR